MIVRNSPLLSAGLVGATETWPRSPLAADDGNPRLRAARRATSVVLVSVCASERPELGLIWPESRVDGLAVACTAIVALDW